MIEKLKAINSIEDFAELGLDQPIYDVSGRGGSFGFSGQSVGNLLGIDADYLPRNIGSYCNYLGGGLRGAIVVSDYFCKITGEKKALLDEFLSACKRVYQNLEDESGLNSDYDDGETNWEAVGTAAARDARIVSAY
jgi:hypothetical protein